MATAEEMLKALGIKPSDHSITVHIPSHGRGGKVTVLPTPAVTPGEPTPEDFEALVADTDAALSEAGIDITEEGVDAPKTTPPSPTALVLDRWDLQRGQDCLAASPVLQAAFPYVDMKTLTDVRRRTELALADIHAVAFQMDPQLAENPDDPRRAEYVRQLLETPEYQVLRQSTVLNDLASEMAATQFGVQYAELVKADKERADKAKSGKGKADPERDAMRSEMGLRRAVAKAVSAAKEEVDALDDVARGLGGDGSMGNTPQEAKKIAEVYKKIRGNKMLAEIFNRAGAYRRFMQSAQRRKTKHGMDDVVNVEQAGDVARLLPVELAKLADDDFELDTLRRLVEGQTFCRQYQGVEKVARGPVVVCVDESGSMNGNPIWNAKAFALAMLNMARQQNRWCCLVGYSGGTKGTWLVIPPGKTDQVKLMEWLAHFFGGGTECDIPLIELPAKWPELVKQGLTRGKTDIIIVTDGIIDVPPNVQQMFNAWKKQEQCRTMGLIIGANGDNGLKTVLDQCFNVKGISLDEEGVATALSI